MNMTSTTSLANSRTRALGTSPLKGSGSPRQWISSLHNRGGAMGWVWVAWRGVRAGRRHAGWGGRNWDARADWVQAASGVGATCWPLRGWLPGLQLCVRARSGAITVADQLPFVLVLLPCPPQHWGHISGLGALAQGRAHLTVVDCRCMHRWKWEQPLVLRCLMILRACRTVCTVESAHRTILVLTLAPLLLPDHQLLALNLTTGFLACSFFCTASAMASGDDLAISAISSSRYTACTQRGESVERQAGSGQRGRSTNHETAGPCTWSRVILGCGGLLYLPVTVDCIPACCQQLGHPASCWSATLVLGGQEGQSRVD